MFDVKTVNQVMDIIKREFRKLDLGHEQVELRDALGRTTAEDVTAHEDIPGFDRSSVDGYAVFSADTFGASETLPAQLKLAGTVQMGKKPDFVLERGYAAYVPTGGQLPEGADAMVMVEYSEDLGDGEVYLHKAAAPGSHLVFRGDDTRVGTVLMKKGTRIRVQDIGALAALGYPRVLAEKRLRVGILSTGDEIVQVDQKPQGSQMRDVNSHLLAAGVREAGGEPVLYGIAGDRYEDIHALVTQALAECHLVLISGGSSVGTRDETLRVMETLEKSALLVHGIAVKPGKPTILARVGQKAVVGLPGHPASAFFIFRVFVRQLIQVLSGTQTVSSRVVKAYMDGNYPSNSGREEYVPVMLEEREGKIKACPVFGKSGLITLLTRADGYVHIQRGAEGLGAGQEVEVELF